tara:strand:- start:6899 stop:7072 length:174 start_codon:yes stop_codon:yes gene_type:complete
MNKEPKEITRENCQHTQRIRFWSKGEIAESAHERVKYYLEFNDADKASLLMSEWIVK